MSTSTTKPALRTASVPSDAELVQLCDRLAFLRTEECSLYRSMPDGDELEAILAPMDQEWWSTVERIHALDGPLTMEGARAMARAIVPCTIHHPDGSFDLLDFAQELTLRLTKFLAVAA